MRPNTLSPFSVYLFLQSIPNSMQTSIFTPKLLRQRSFFRFLLPLFAIFAGVTQQAMAQGPAIDDVELIFSQKPTAAGSATTVHYAGNGALDTPYSGYTKLGSASPTPATPPPSLGTYDINTGGTSTLTLTGSSLVAEPTTVRGVTANPTAARVRYRVYLNGTSAGNLPSFSIITLNNAGPFPGFPAATLFNATTSLNLLNGLLSGGTYTVEANFEADYSNGSTQTAVGNTYTATFDVSAPTVTPPGGTTTWIATVSTDWTNAANWSNGVPTRFADAIIPEKNNSNTNTSTPALLDPNPNLYEVRSLTLNGTTNATRALLRIGQTTAQNVTTGATLNVYGDLNTFGGGILGSQTGSNGIANQALNSTIFFRGDIRQVVRGLLEIADVHMTGTGDKLVVNSISVANTLTFEPGTSGHIRTVTETVNPSTGVSTFTLNTSKTANINLKSTGLLFGETNNAYIEGVTLADRNLLAGQTQTFGNIGVDITPNRDILGPTVSITRTVGDPLSGPVTPTSPRPVKRQYGISGDVNNAPTVSTLTFHYLDSADELNGNTEPSLTIFRTTNNGIPYAKIGGVADVAANTVTQTGVTSINTITLGDVNNPLPVTVSSFDAKRAGSDALVSWTTAQEINNKGFNIQVSTNGAEYRTLGFVSSTSPNSNSAKSYSFTDTEKNKVGVRYYRLQQIDTDGKTAFFAPRTVSFEGRATGSGVLAYPNPYTTDLRVSLNASVSGNATARISDMTGRVIGLQVLPLTIGSNDLSIENMSTLKTGIYVLTVSLPSGETKSIRVVKQ